jgi:hypothetical protein
MNNSYEFKQTRYISRKSVCGFEPGTDGFRLLVLSVIWWHISGYTVNGSHLLSCV